jgi:hypothetical protein
MLVMDEDWVDGPTRMTVPHFLAHKRGGLSGKLGSFTSHHWRLYNRRRNRNRIMTQ